VSTELTAGGWADWAGDLADLTERDPGGPVRLLLVLVHKVDKLQVAVFGATASVSAAATAVAGGQVVAPPLKSGCSWMMNLGRKVGCSRR